MDQVSNYEKYGLNCDKNELTMLYGGILPINDKMKELFIKLIKIAEACNIPVMQPISMAYPGKYIASSNLVCAPTLLPELYYGAYIDSNEFTFVTIERDKKYWTTLLENSRSGHN